MAGKAVAERLTGLPCPTCGDARNGVSDTRVERLGAVVIRVGKGRTPSALIAAALASDGPEHALRVARYGEAPHGCYIAELGPPALGVDRRPGVLYYAAAWRELPRRDRWQLLAAAVLLGLPVGGEGLPP